jgi:SAM-dependent methyltransferase
MKEIFMTKNRRYWPNIYDDLLKYQAELSHDLEQMFFRSSPQWQKAKKVLDFGAGNAHYTNLLAINWPDKKYFCVELNEDLFNIAVREISAHNIKIIKGSFDELGEGNNFDFVYCRHVLSYLKENERKNFFTWAYRNTSPGSCVLTIDADDDAFYTFPALPLLESGNKKFKDDLKKSGGNRELRAELLKHVDYIGFTHFSTRSLIVHSAISGRKYLMSMFMKAVAEIDHGSPLPLGVRDEIDSWSSNRNSYLQYGMFGSLFIKR